MDWFRQNPFYGLLAAAGGLAVALAGYYLFEASGRYQAAAATFAEQKAVLQSLQDSKPFPDADNVRRSTEELDVARTVLGEIAGGLVVEAPATTPQAFQDELRQMVNDIVSRAAAAGVALGEGFYLGFGTYETQPPPAAAAAQLALQLRSIHAVASILVEARVTEITAINRLPLAVEAGAPGGDEARGKPSGAAESLPDLTLAPFDVDFTADQSAFRVAFNKILATEPPVFVRLLAVSNSAPTAPPKAAASGETEAGAAIKPVLGKELAVVSLRLASVSAAPTPAN